MMKPLYFFLILFAAGCGGVLFLASGAVDEQPTVRPHHELSFDNVKRVKQLVRQHAPRYMRFRQVRRVRISQKDLNLLLDYGLSQGLDTDRAAADIALSPALVSLTASLRIPPTPMGEYLNLELGIGIGKNRPDIAFVRAGDLKIPGGLIRPLIPVVGRRILDGETLGLIEETLNGIRSVSVSGNTLNLVYDWNPDALAALSENGKSRLLPLAHQERLVDYTNQITRVLAVLNPNGPRPLSLARVLRPLFLYASSQPGAPATENTALLQALALYCLGKDPAHLVGTDLKTKIAPRRRAGFTLLGRRDLAKHFLVSAGLGVSAGSRLSHFAGLAKEVDDAGRGSGFSFADLAADKAGVRMGELAAGSPGQAARLQQAMSRLDGEADFMPGIGRLPEGIPEGEFKKRFRDLDSETYGLIEGEIRQRIDRCRAYRESAEG